MNRKSKAYLGLSLILWGLISTLASQTAKAQTGYTNHIFLAEKIPGIKDLQTPSPSPFPLPQIPSILPPPIELLPPRGNTPPEKLPDNHNKNIIIEKFDVIGSTVFSPQTLAKELTEFTGRPISLAEVFQARSKITNLYIKNGYITSGAYIPPQNIQSGVIKIQVIEGKLEDIQIIGNQRLHASYIRSRLAIATPAPLNRDRLLEALRLLQINPLIANLSAELSAGSHPGMNILQVKVSEAKTLHSQITLDNGRSPSVGSFRRRLNISEANFLGWGDSFNVTYTNTDGSDSVDATYTLPINAENGTLALTFSDTTSHVIEQPFNVLDIQSSSRNYELTWRQPIIQTSTKELAIGLTASHRESEASYIPGSRIPFPSLGADAQGRTRLSALRFFQEWTTRNNREVIAVRSQFSQGIDLFSPTFNTSPPDNRFFAWQGQAQWARLLAPDTLFLLRTNTEIASREILPLEQLSLSGIDSVRGYRQDYLLTDNGTFASAEIHIPILRLPKIRGMLQVIPFFDFGFGWNNTNKNDISTNILAATGLGWQWTQKNFTARLDWGIPLTSSNSQGSTWQENGVYFSLQYNPF
jgi:hemolysin activation/secretion protein